jgi:hypothetical protein
LRERAGRQALGEVQALRCEHIVPVEAVQRLSHQPSERPYTEGEENLGYHVALVVQLLNELLGLSIVG